MRQHKFMASKANPVHRHKLLLPLLLKKGPDTLEFSAEPGAWSLGILCGYEAVAYCEVIIAGSDLIVC